MIENLTADLQVFTSNAFLVTGERPVLVDTGANFDLVGALESRGVEPAAVILTHTHEDHVGNVDAVTEAFSIETWGYDTDNPLVDNPIADEDTVAMGDHDYLALYTPGHKNDHLCFYARASGILFTGDLIFQNGAFGRTDLPEGDRDRLIQSIDRLLGVVDADMNEFHTGHGPSVTEDAYEHLELARRYAETF